MSEISKYEEENILGADTSNLTLWKIHKTMIETRPVGWLKRFGQKVDDAILLDPPRTHEEQREDRMRASGWEPITKELPVKPLRFKEDKISSIKPFPGPCSNLCYLCWGIVPIGPSRVTCTICAISSHNTCVVNALRYKLPVVPSTQVNVNVQRSLQEYPAYYNSSGVICNWVCPLCIQEVHLRNNVCERVYQIKRKAYSEEYAAIKIQSFARMVRPKADFTRVIVGILILQRTLRARRYWRKAEGEKRSALLKPFRVRIHGVYVLINLDSAAEGVSSSEANAEETMVNGLEGSNSNTTSTMKPFHNLIGEMSANAFAEIMKSEHAPDPTSLTTGAVTTTTTSSSVLTTPTTGLPLLTIPGASSTNANNAATTLTSGSSADGTACSDDFLSLLRNGHIEVPSFMQPFKLAPGKVVNRGSYFLTVSVQRARHLRDTDPNYEDIKQLYRIDTQLRVDGSPMKLTPLLAKRLGMELDASGCEAFSHFRVQKLLLSKPYILFPASDSCVVVKLVVSQTYTVAEIFKTAVVGMATVPINTNIIWKRNFSANTGLVPVDTIDDLPTADDGCRVDLHAKRPALTTQSSLTAVTSSNKKYPADSIRRDHGRTGGAVSSKLKLSEEERVPGQPAGAVVTWSLLTVSYDLGDFAGEVFLLSQPFIQASRRRQWITLIDRVLRIYSTPSDLLPNLIFDLRSTHVVPLDGGIIRVKYRLDTWFFYFIKPAEGIEWLRKMYSQSISNDIRKYSDAMIVPKRVPGLGAGMSSAGASATKAIHGGVSWEEYLGDLLPGVCAGLGEEFGYGEDDASCHSGMRSPRSLSTTPHTVRSTPGTARRTPATPVPSTPSPVPDSSTVGPDAAVAHNKNTSSKATKAMDLQRPQSKNKSMRAASISVSTKLPPTSPGHVSSSLAINTLSPGATHHRTTVSEHNQGRAPLSGAASPMAVPLLPLLKASTTSTSSTTVRKKMPNLLSKRENMMLHVFAQAAKQFQA